MNASAKPQRHSNQQVKVALLSLYDDLIAHNGYANLHVEIRILKRGQKEVIIDAGKQFRFVVDGPVPAQPSASAPAPAPTGVDAPSIDGPERGTP
ncbi:MAG: hypothetical protein QM766_12930 [Burkholderiaceae bacterium]